MLDDLLELVETMRRLVDWHGAAMRENQPLTRDALVEPLLRRLGWGVADADLVSQAEGSGASDYTLLMRGQATAVVKVEPLDGVLEGTIAGMAAAARRAGAPRYVITNGRRWLVYNTGVEYTEETAPVAEFSLDGGAADTCVKALVLWPPLVAPERLPRERSFGEPPPLWDERRQVEHEVSWRSLASLEVTQGDPAPAELRFPNGERRQTGTWIALPVEATRWLVQRGLLDAKTPPIQVGSKYILATLPVHPSGAPFAQVKEVAPLYLEAKYRSTDCARHTLLIIAHAGMDPAQFRVRLAE